MIDLFLRYAKIEAAKWDEDAIEAYIQTYTI